MRSAKTNAFMRPIKSHLLTSMLVIASLQPHFAADPISAIATNDQPYRLDTITVLGSAETGPANVGSATTISGGALTDRGVTSPRELTAITPNLTTFDANGDRTPRFSLRGLRENNFSYGESAVGIYVDDVPYSDLYTRGTPLFNVESGEFFRGPQPGLFGANRPGGVLNLLTRLPGNAVRANGSVSYGNYDALAINGGVSGPIVKDNLFLGLSGLFNQRDGYFDNLVTGNDPDTRETLAGRAQLRWLATDRVDITATVVADRMRDGAIITRPITAPGDIYDVEYDNDGHNDLESQTYSLRAAWTGDSVEAISVTTFRNWKQDLAGDFDFYLFEFNIPGTAPVRAFEGIASPKVESWSQEFRLQSLETDSALKWNSGLYWAHTTTDYSSGQRYGPDAAASLGNPFLFDGATDLVFGQRKTDNLALFGQTTYSATEKLDLTAGLRLEHFNVEGDRNHTFAGAPIAAVRTFDESYNSIQPKLAATFHLTTNLSAWASFTTGFQPGGFNPSSDLAALSTYDESTSLHYEIGSSASLLDGKLLLSAAGFWIDSDDYQVYRLVGPGPTDFSVLNAQAVRTLGAELELRALPCKQFEFRLAGGYQHAEFRDFTTPTAQNLDGNRVNFVPEFTLDASVTSRLKCGAFGTLGVTGVGEYWFDETNTAKQGEYALLYARVGWQGKHWGIAAFGKNLTGKKYYANALDLGGGTILGTPGDPLTWGIELSAKF